MEGFQLLGNICHNTDPTLKKKKNTKFDSKMGSRKGPLLAGPVWLQNITNRQIGRFLPYGDGVDRIRVSYSYLL